MNLDAELAGQFGAVPTGSIDWLHAGPDDVVGIRASMAAAAGAEPRPPDPSGDIQVEDRMVALPDTADSVGVRIVRPQPEAGPRPGLVWIHGGGYILGSALAPDSRINRWVEVLGCVVVSVDYRLAPEHPYPAPLDDCWLALRWTFEHAGELGIASDRIGVGGASAGGGLAAAVAARARDSGRPGLAFQLLQYPMIDDRSATSAANGLCDDPIWPRAANRLGWRCYLAGGAEVSPYAAVARLADVRGLPPTAIMVGELDLFRDEDLRYASRLMSAGVSTELHVYSGAPHGFDSVAPTAAVSRRCRRDMEEFLTRVMG